VSDRWRVLATAGWGSAIVEAALELAGIAYDRDECDRDDPADRARLDKLNPLAQIPTVILPDGRTMTETAALVLYIAELAPHAQLAPPPGDALRGELLRWLVFFVAAIYPTFTYGDWPARWTGAGADELRASTDAHRESLWRYLEANVVRGPWFLGERRSALDLYVAVMTRWRPRRGWFAEHCPKLAAIAAAIDREPKLARWREVNFARDAGATL
jgi:GST-like protein